jgi:thiol-disulfide isomerase/thioredoxin
MTDGKHCPACGKDIGYRSIVIATLPTQIRCPHCASRLAHDRVALVLLIEVLVILALVASSWWVLRALVGFTAPLALAFCVGALLLVWGLLCELVAAWFLRTRRTLRVLEPAARTWTGFRGSAALRGSLEGAIVIGVSGLLGIWIATRQMDLMAGCFAAFAGAVMFASGRGIAGRVGGAALLGTFGIILGGIAGERLIGQIRYETPAVVQPDREIEIAGPTLSGDTFDLRSRRGKVVLVDFWATWCGPCIAELPNLKKMYETYHPRGFEVVGISLDRNMEALTKFLDKEKLPWVSLYDQTKGNGLADYYGVNFIPLPILVDQEGRVVSMNARGAELGKLLEKYLPEKK